MSLSEKDEARRWMETADRLQREMGDLNERMAKAREILRTILSLGDWEDVKRALDALEGK